MSADNDTRNAPGTKVGVVAQINETRGGVITPCGSENCPGISFSPDAVTGLSDLKIGCQVLYKEGFPFPDVNALWSGLLRVHCRDKISQANRTISCLFLLH